MLAKKRSILGKIEQKYSSFDKSSEMLKNVKRNFITNIFYNDYIENAMKEER
jgi:hypothetical protein